MWAHPMANFTRWMQYREAKNAISSSPIVVNGIVYVGSEDKKLYALDANTGQKLWDFTTNGGISSSPAVANGIVYVGSKDQKLYAVEATTGKKIWEAKTDGEVLSPSVLMQSGQVFHAGISGNQP
jgi:outer membrane protein assembly factor BamB